MALSASGLYCANFKSIIQNDVAMDWLANANKVAPRSCGTWSRPCC